MMRILYVLSEKRFHNCDVRYLSWSGTRRSSTPIRYLVRQEFRTTLEEGCDVYVRI